MLGTNFDPFNQRPPQQPVYRPAPDLTPKQQRKAQRKQVTRFLFNPELGSSLQGLKETHGLFLNLIANVFLQTNLIDAAYPGFRDPKQLGLISLLKYAYKDLRFTRDGMGQVLLFAGFVSSMVAMVLALFMFVLSLMHSTPKPPVRTAAPPAAQAQPVAPAMQRTAPR